MIQIDLVKASRCHLFTLAGSAVAAGGIAVAVAVAVDVDIAAVAAGSAAVVAVAVVAVVVAAAVEGAPDASVVPSSCLHPFQRFQHHLCLAAAVVVAVVVAIAAFAGSVIDPVVVLDIGH